MGLGTRLALNQATEKNWLKSYLITTLPGFLLQNAWHVCCHTVFNGAKHALSNGCVIWVVFGGSTNRIILFLPTMSTSTREMQPGTIYKCCR